MSKRIGLGEGAFLGFIYAFLIFLMIVTLYPLIYVAFASLSRPDLMMSFSGILWRPLGFSLKSYEQVLQNPSIYSGYINTIIIVVAGVIVNLTFTSLGAYVLSRKHVMWNNAIIFYIVATMFFNGGLIPFYLVVKNMGLLDSLASLIIPFAINTFHLIILRTSFQAIPDELLESAGMDGAGHLTMFSRIVIPLSLPILAVIGLYIAVDKWNAWFHASIFLRDRNLYPLQLALRQILIDNSTDALSNGTAGNNDQYLIGVTIKYATIMVATLPILFVYPFLQKYFTKGVMIGAIKG